MRQMLRAIAFAPDLAPIRGDRNCDHSGGRRRTVLNQGWPAGVPAHSEEVESPVNGPDQCDPKGQERFHLGSIPHKRADHIERHAGQVGE